jgi:hypothetical protein
MEEKIDQKFLQILIEHKKKYPLMQIEDFVKLIYQSEYGMTNYQERSPSFNLLSFEMMRESKFRPQPFEDIGNGMVRIYLNHPYVSLPNLFMAIKKTIFKTAGDDFEFREKLNYLEIFHKELGISLDDFKAYVDKIEKEGTMNISHSETYIKNYNTAYRVISKDFLKEVYE